jgi:hypothetical protein
MIFNNKSETDHLKDAGWILLLITPELTWLNALSSKFSCRVFWIKEENNGQCNNFHL